VDVDRVQRRAIRLIYSPTFGVFFMEKILMKSRKFNTMLWRQVNSFYIKNCGLACLANIKPRVQMPVLPKKILTSLCQIFEYDWCFSLYLEWVITMLIIFFCDVESWTQGLVHARQVFCHSATLLDTLS
jgi:hypothetical protein